MGDNLHITAEHGMPITGVKAVSYSKPWSHVRLYLGAHGWVVAKRCLLAGTNALINPVDFYGMTSRVFYDNKVNPDRLRLFLRLNQRIYAKKSTFEQRCRAIRKHFDLVASRFGLDFIEGCRGGKLLLWEGRRGDDNFAIHLRLPLDYYRYESELAVTFGHDGTILFTIAFVFCNPDSVTDRDPTAFVTRLQGTR